MITNFSRLSLIPLAGSDAGEGGFDLCYLGHSGVILMTLLTSLSTATLLLLDHHLHRHHNRKCVTHNTSIISTLRYHSNKSLQYYV